MKPDNPFISICIPAYKRTNFLKRLMQSIESQTYKDFEVIVSDDSDDDSVLQLINDFEGKINIRYYKNEKALGTPANWNFAIAQSKGEWVKLMHDDDWFASDESLAAFAAQTTAGNKFIFSAYSNCLEGSAKTEHKFLPAIAKNRIIKHPVSLLATNVIGPPSVTMLHHSITEKYDERMKWRVDLDFYIRILLQEKAFSYKGQLLINVGVSESQVTNACINIPSVELPEGYLLLQKYGTKPLKNILVYDAWWRILRNLDIKNQQQLEEFGQTEWPVVILSMLKHLSLWSKQMLRIGIISKFAMSCSYCDQYFKSNF